MKFGKIQDIAGLASKLGMSAKGLAYIAFAMPEDQKYTRFEILKKSGEKRLIHAPTKKLKFVQRKLADFLQDRLEEIEVTSGINEQCALAHGFHRQRSIITNAQLHLKRKWVLNCDIEDFFGTINFGRVRGYFLANKHFHFSGQVATAIARIACHDGALPQGSPCSPVISNLIAQVMDVRLSKLATRCKCRYSRYADDLTFSTSTPSMSSDLVELFDGAYSAGTLLTQTVNKCGFKLNSRKTRLQFNRSRQDCTGLIINERLGVAREYRKTLRAQVHRLVKFGHATGTDKHPISTSRLRGRLSHVSSVLNYRSQEASPNEPTSSGFNRDYREFLDFVRFANISRPVIMTEGVTDDSYIRSAISALYPDFPLLAAGPNSSERHIDFFRYTPTSSLIQSLSGGTGDMKQLIYRYNQRVARMSAAAFSSPLILVVDNDVGAKEVFGAVKNVAKKSKDVDGSESFYYVTKNLYVVPLPKVKATGTAIEDLLSSKVLKTSLGGKTYQPDDKLFDDRVNFGKAALAKHVKSNAQHIDFSGFKGLLKSLEGVIGDYKTRRSS